MRNTNKIFGLFFLTVLLVQGKTQWRTWFVARCTYDDNIFCLSPLEREQFQRSKNPAKFPYRSVDDLDVMLSGRLRWENRRRQAQLGFRVHQFLSNAEKSYGLLQAGWEESLTKRNSLVFSYVWMPNYLIRYYRDRTVSGERYAPCRFAEHLLGIQFRQKLGTVVVKPGYRLEFDNYLRPFEYYNTMAHRFGLEVDWKPKENLYFDCAYAFKNARAKGPVPDISYYEHGITVGSESRPRRFNRFGIEVGYSFVYRRYTTRTDAYHYGRVDQIQEMKLGCDYRLAPVVLVFFYQLEWREVSLPERADVEDIKEYRASRFSFGVTIPFKNSPGKISRKGAKG